MNYDKARNLVTRLAERTEKQENEKDEKWYSEETTDEERENDSEEAAEIKEAIEIGGNLLIDIAESLNRIAEGDKLSRGRQM